jgi:hypothetical protein
MKRKFSSPIWLVLFIITLLVQACSANAPVATATKAATSTPEPPTPTSTKTPVPSATPRPTRTPNLAATQQFEEWDAEAQSYVEAGYLTTSEGKFYKLDTFSEEWAQLGWYWRWPVNISARDFFMSGRLRWSSAYRSADISGCGFIFAEQENGDHYAVFLDRSKVLFVETEEYYYPIGPTRGTGRVNFGNPFDHAVEADFTLIVEDAYAYVLVDGELVGEYTLSQSKNLRGTIGTALLSGTNKDFGTRCIITNFHAWVRND